MLAPTDLSGENSQPDLRPQVVSNSWGGGVGNTWYQWVVQAWRASGIFPVFSIGNSGSACYSASSPGDYPESFGVGATDSNDTIAYFSSRGPSWDGRIKPDVSAPGYNIRSSVPGNGYDWYSGTSMAAPHVAGTVALLWSAAPALIGDLQQTADLLNNNTLNLIDTQCGGDPWRSEQRLRQRPRRCLRQCSGSTPHRRHVARHRHGRGGKPASADDIHLARPR